MKKEIKDKDETKEFVSSLMKEQKYVVDVQQLSDDAGYLIQWQEHKTYLAHDGKEFKDEIWITEAGDMLQIQDISAEHCRNVIRMILRNEREANAAFDMLTDRLVETYQQGGLMIDEASETPPTLH